MSQIMNMRVRALLVVSLAVLLSASNSAPLAPGMTIAAHADTWDCAAAKTTCFLLHSYCGYVRKKCA